MDNAEPASGILSLDSKLEDCEIGVEKTVTVRVVPTANDDESGFTADVKEVVDYEESESDKPEKPMPKNMRGMAPAVAVVIGAKPKGKY